ncbi:MAG: S8 family serine peptidase [Bacteroidales bacterium]|nr:S8 family serine peptidase [Bacteroidales bacterium]
MRKNILLAIFMAVVCHFNVWAAMDTDKHWNCDPTLYPDNMTIVGVVEIDGAEQGNTSLEVGAFCGTECRGSEMLHHFPQVERYLVFLTVYGEDNDAITFKLYDHDTEMELDAYIDGMTFTINAMHGTPMEPYEFNFIPYYNVTVAAYPTEAGSVAGGGHLLAHEQVTLTATPNTGYGFVNWTENGVVVGAEPILQFENLGDRSLVANFEIIMHHVDVGVNFEVAGSATGAGDFQECSTVTVSATPNTGFVFDRWSENGETVSNSASYAFAIWGDRDLTAEFKLAITDTTAFSCVEYDWHGQNYTSSGTYYDTLSSYLGIDSIVALHLTIYPAYAYNLYETACDSFLWNDTYYYESGDYVDAHQSIHGCDSIYTLHLTINTTRPLGNFTYMVPANNYINRYTDVNFYWDGVVNANCYDFYFWEDGNDRPTDPTIANSTSVTAQRSGLEHGITYHWCVVAKNECVEIESAERTFVCQLDPAMSVIPQGSLDFGEVEVGQSSSKNIAVSATALSEDISYSFLENEYGADADFFIITPSSNWNALKGGTLQVTFTPVAEQLYYNSAIRIASGAFVDTIYFTGSMANRYVFTTNVDGDVFTANDSITITGHVADVLGNDVSDLDVDVYLLVWGMRTTLRTTSDENGDYTVKYGPRSSESGYYQVGSCEKNKNASAIHDAFDIPGMSRTTNNFIIWDIYQDETVTGSISIRNRSRIPLGSIQVVPIAVPEGLEASFDSFSLDALETGDLHYTFTGTEISTNNSYAEAVFQLVSSDGITLNLTCYYLCRQRRGDLDVYPPSVSTTMKRNAQKMLTFQVTNNGNGETGAISIDLPNVEWMTVMGGDSLASIAVGDSVAFSIRLFPDENVPLTEYTGNLAVNCANGNGFSVPYTIQATSDSTGMLVVDVTDDYTYNTNNGSGPHLEGASVYVVGYYSLETVAQGETDSDGLFTVEDLPEGYYYLTVRAQSHDEYNNGIIYIEGGKTNTQEIYLQFQAISASWTVVPTEVQDEYGLFLNNEIKTNVPVPVVLIEGPSFFDTLEYGDTLQYSMTVSNRGLVDAYDTHITIEENYDEYVFIPMFDVIDTIHPHDVIIVPCIMTRVEGGREASSGRDLCKIGFDKSLAWYRCNQQLKCVEYQTQFTVGAPFVCSDYASYHPVSQTNPNNPNNNSGNSNPVNPPIPNGLQNNSYQSHQNASPEVATTSQDCVPCWKSLNLPVTRTGESLLDYDAELQELIRMSRSYTTEDLSCTETGNTATEWPLWTQTGDLSKIDPELQTLMRDSRDGNETFRVIIEMKDQYDNPNLERGTALMTRAERRDYVVNELKRFSEGSQSEITRYLDALATRGGVRVLHHFWIFNGVCCEATASCIDELSLRNDVRFVSLDKKIVMDDPMERSGDDRANPPQTGVQWHVSRIQADQVWDMGYNGNGVVVAIIDTGVNYEHEDIKNKMWDGGEQYKHGWDFYENDNDPMDRTTEVGHGTHVAGIVAGDGTQYKTGVAPGATIMALKVAGDYHSDDNDEFGSQSIVGHAVEFAVEHGADVLNLSIGWHGSGGIAYFRKKFENVLKAGVVAVVSAGNQRGNYQVPNMIDAPGNCPPPWCHPDQDQVLPSGYEYKPSAVICVGATTKAEENTIAWYSSIGPVTWQNVVGYHDFPYENGSSTNTGLIRPDIVAPGGLGKNEPGSVWSLRHNHFNWISNSYTGYVGYQGTSMATPCVAGVVALMLQANPNLTPEKIDEILETTATHLGEPGKNNQYGSGLVNAKAAVTAALALLDDMPQRYHITTDQVPFSYCTTVSGGGYYEFGEQCELQASPEYFSHWERNGEFISDEPNITVDVTADAHYVAYYDEAVVCYYVEVTTNLLEGVSGSIIVDGGNGVGVYPNGFGIYSYYINQPCTVSITPKQGYEFHGWFNGDGEFIPVPMIPMFSDYTFTVKDNTKLTAVITPIPITYGAGAVAPPPTLQDLSSNANLLNSYSDAISNCTSGNSRDSNEGENLISQLDQCYNFYQAILNVYTNLFQEAEWMEEQNIAQFLDNFYAFMDPIDRTVSPQAMQQLIELSELTSANAATIQSFVERWNRSVQYWNEGIYTLADLPEGYDPNFVQQDSTILQPAEAACEYAVANGFSNFSDMYYTSLSDCNDLVREHQTDVCAKVSVQFKQTMAMTREAFEGTLKITNGHTTDPMQNIDVNLTIKDAYGQDKTDLFQINVVSLDKITEVDGSGTLAAQTEGVVQFLMIPTIEAAPDDTVIYSFGGSFTFLDPFSGEEMTYQLYPVDLEVYPGPNLYIDYFVQRDIISDDPLTQDTIEPMEEAEIAMMIRNLGAGPANNVYLESAQPEIINNQNNLLIAIDMSGSAMNGERRPFGMTNIPFGTIESHTNGIAEWYFTSSLIGRVVNSTAQVVHNNSYGNPKLSLVSAVNTHELIKAILAYGALNDSINDFLVNEIFDLGHIPDKLYFSNGDTTNVVKADHLVALDSVTHQNNTVTLELYPSAAGWNYDTVADPGHGLYELLSCTRSDGQEIPLNNVWITHVTIPHDDTPIHENLLHIVDTLSTDEMVTYTLVYDVVLIETYEITATANSDEWGTVTGGGTYEEGTTCTLTATPAEGYAFVNWTKDGEVVSTEATYSFTVTEAGDYIGNFGLITNQAITLEQGWNWWSSYIDLEANGLTQVENGLGENGIYIKSQDNGFVGKDGSDWFGSLLGLHNQDMYMIQASAPVQFTMSGVCVNASQLDMDLVTGWNWIGYPLTSEQSVNNALLQLDANDGDILKTLDKMCIYDVDGWYGTLHNMNPGQGYLFYSEQPHSFNYVVGRDELKEELNWLCHWNSKARYYGNNMSFIATVALNGEELRSEAYELAAFCNGTSLGSTRLLYNARRDRYYALLPVPGEEGMKVSFRLYQADSGYEYPDQAEETCSFVINGINGSLDEPVVLHFGSENQAEAAVLRFYPNPVKKDGMVRLSLPETVGPVRVEIYNVLDVLLVTEEITGNSFNIGSTLASGTYVLRVFDGKGKMYYGKLIVE